ncbi:NAD(P)-dependent oxidoreductase [Gordonia sinesedis]
MTGIESAASDSEPTRLGFVGLGNIGGPMAGRLAAWPDGLAVFDLSADAVTGLAAQGATPAGSLADLAARSDVVGVCVVNDDQVRSVIAGTASSGAGGTEGTGDGLLAGAAPGTVIAVHSTISPDTALDLAARCAEAGVTLVDAPISGGAPGAEQGRLAVMVGGPPDAYRRLVRPYALTADLMVHAGDEVGAGTRMKLARNLLHFVSFAATTEAARLAEAAGLDLAQLGKVVRHTDAITGGAGAIMLRDTTAPIEPDDFWYGIFTHVRTLGEKDLRLAVDLGRDLGVDLPLAQNALRDLATGLGVPHREGEPA